MHVHEFHCNKVETGSKPNVRPTSKEMLRDIILIGTRHVRSLRASGNLRNYKAYVVVDRCNIICLNKTRWKNNCEASTNEGCISCTTIATKENMNVVLDSWVIIRTP